MKGIGHFAPQARGVDVIGGAHERARHQPFTRERAVILRPFTHPFFVHGEGFAGENGAVACEIFVQRRGGNFAYHGAQLGELIDCRFDARRNFRVSLHVARVKVAQHAYAYAFDVLA